MGLLQNGFRHNAIGKLFGGTNLDGANPSVHEYRGHLTGRMRNQFAGEGITDDLASVPNGARHPVAWVMARTNGGNISTGPRSNDDNVCMHVFHETYCNQPQTKRQPRTNQNRIQADGWIIFLLPS